MRTNYLKKASKRILYTIRKKTNVDSKDMCFGRLDNIRGIQATLENLKKKGLIFQDLEPLRGKENKVSVRAIYWLTPEGIKIADKIVKEIDEYKRW